MNRHQISPSAADRTRCPDIPLYYLLMAANEHGSLYLSRSARARFALSCAGRVSRMASVVRTRRRPTAAA